MSGTWLVAIPVVIVGWFVVTWNRLIRLRQHVRESRSDIDTELKRRHDLIPNLVAVVAGAAAHEKDTLARVTALRTKVDVARDRQPMDGQHDIAVAARDILAVAEAYPELKANQNFLDLQDQLTETEDRVQASRRFLNGNVRLYVTTIESMPARVVAGLLGFEPEPYCEVEPVIRKVVDVSLP